MIEDKEFMIKEMPNGKFRIYRRYNDGIFIKRYVWMRITDNGNTMGRYSIPMRDLKTIDEAELRIERIKNPIRIYL